MNSPKISIIVPVYNMEKYLSQCIDSILSQTFTNFELLLINDGSSDNSGTICDRYAERDDRIRVFHKQNGGVSSARNFGLNHAIGEWVTFVDSDDWLEKDFLSGLMSYTNYSFVVGGFKRFGDLVDESKPKTTSIVNISEDLPRLWNTTLDKFIFWYVWGKLYRMDIIKLYHIEFQLNMKYNEDNCFVMDYMNCVNFFIFVNRSNYIHLFEKNRSRKYHMDFETLKTHIDRQEQSFLKLENKTGYRYRLVRQNVHRRFFDSFVCQLLDRTDYPSYYIELNKFKKFDSKGIYLDEVSYSFRRQLLKLVLFRFPCILGYTFRRLILRMAY